MNTPSQYYLDYMEFMTTQDAAIVVMVSLTLMLLLAYCAMRWLARFPTTGKLFTAAAQVFPYAVLLSYAWLVFEVWSRTL